MANKSFVVQYIIKARDKFSRKADDIKKSAGKISIAFDSMARRARLASKEFSKTAKKIGKFTDIGKKLSTRVTLPMAALGTVALAQSAKIETLITSFETMTGSAAKGRKLMADVIRFTATTPFKLAGVAQSTKTLLAFKVPLKDMTSRLRMLGDIAAGTDAPLSEIAKIFGKVKAKGKLMTEEILQLSDRGIPIIDLLSKVYGRSKMEIFKLASQSKISFSAMDKMMQKMTSSGGIFYKQTIKQSKTLTGRFSTLTDNLLILSAAIGDIISGVFGLKGGMSELSDRIVDITSKIKLFAKENPAITKMIVLFGVLVASIGPIIVALGNVAIAVIALKVAFALFGVTSFAAMLPILIVVTALATAAYLVIDNWTIVKDFFTGLKLVLMDVFESIDERISNIKKGFSYIVNKIPSLPSFSDVKSGFSGIFGSDDSKTTSTLNKSQVDVGVNIGLDQGLKQITPAAVLTNNVRRADVGFAQ